MPTCTITELAHEFGLTPRAIRDYEDQGPITPGGKAPAVGCTVIRLVSEPV